MKARKTLRQQLNEAKRKLADFEKRVGYTHDSCLRCNGSKQISLAVETGGEEWGFVRCPDCARRVR